MVSLSDIQISRGHEPEAPMDVDAASEDTATIGPLITGSDDERRMQVRAYKLWLSQAQTGELPPIEGLHPETLGDLGANGALVDFTLGLASPALIFLGNALAAECGDDRDIFNLGDVPERSLLSRLTEHCLEVIANRAPVGFDAEFDDRQDRLVLYRSILLPYSSDGERVDFVYGVISWKHADRPPPSGLLAPIIASAATLIAPTPQPERQILAGLLASARNLADQAQASEGRSRRALYAAVSRAYDVAIAARSCPGELVSLLTEASSIKNPQLSLVRAVFGTNWPKSRLSEFAIVLGHAERLGLEKGALEAVLLAAAGGLKGLVAAERTYRRGSAAACRRTLRPGLARRLRTMPASAESEASDEFSLLVARRNRDGTLSILGDAGELRLLEKAAKHLMSS